MSLYFDLVINCYMREGITEEQVKVLHYLTDPNYVLDFTPVLNVPSMSPSGDYDVWSDSWRHLLAPNPHNQSISQLKNIHHTTIRHEVYLWLLQYTGRWLHDDSFYESYMPLIYWLATISKEGLIGYSKETDYNLDGVELYFSINRSLETIGVSPPLTAKINPTPNS